MALAFFACAGLPVSIIVIASSGSAMAVARQVPPRPGCRPSITSGKPRLASETAMRMSQASASSRPAPRQWPWRTAMVLASTLERRSSTACASPSIASMSAVEAPTNCWMSAPAAKPDGLAERRTTAAGFSATMRSTKADSSSTTERSTVLTALSGRSRTIHITRSSSIATRKFPVRSAFAAGPSSRRRSASASSIFPMGSVLVFWFVKVTAVRPLRAASRRPGHRRCIRWRCRASCRGASWRPQDAG